MKTEDIRAAAERVKAAGGLIPVANQVSEEEIVAFVDFVLSRCDVASDELVAEMRQLLDEADRRLPDNKLKNRISAILNRLEAAEAQIAALTEERDRLSEKCTQASDAERATADALEEASTFGICTAPTIHDIGGRRYRVTVELVADFHCKVCGSSTLIAPDWPERGVCPDHCEDHDYEYEPGERRRYCKTCGQEPPWGWGED